MNDLMLTETDIDKVVPEFYARVRKDPLLGPIFNGAVDDWPDHLERLKAFWSSVMLTSGRYKGQPVPAHVRHGTLITPETFTQWLSLWKETTDELLEPQDAAAMQEKAARIAQSLMMAIQFYSDRQQQMASAPAEAG